MKEERPPAAVDPSDEIGALVQNLDTTQRRLQELTVGQVDAVMHPGGHAYLLHKAQEKLQKSETAQRQLAETMSAILNALPAHIALLDAHGVIVSVNDIWRQFATANELQGPSLGVNQNYLEVCERATGDCYEGAQKAAAGIRAVLAGTTAQFSLEYPCHSPTEQRWFLLLATPVSKGLPAGAVVMHMDITERKLAEESIRMSEERFRNMFNSAATGIAVSTPDGRFLQVNTAYCRMVGYTPDELLVTNFAALTHPEDLALNLKLRDDLLAGKQDSFLMEKRYLKKNGDIVWTRHSVSATHASNGEIATLMVVAEDITERKLAEEALHRQQIELQALFDLIPAMLCFKDTENIFLRVNQRLADSVGRSIADIEGKPVAEIFPRDAAKYFADDLEVIRSGLPKLEIFEHLQIKDGQDLWVQTDKVPVVGRDGKVTGIVVMIQDITERRRAEEKLTLFRTLIEGSPDAIEVIEPETGRYLDVNETGCRRLGYSREEMLALNVADIGVERDYWAVWPAVAEEIKKAGFATIIERHRRKDGSTFPVEVNARYLNLNQGYLVAVVRDITERKRNEARLRRLIDSNVQGVVFGNMRGDITEANDAFLHLVGYSREELRAGLLRWKDLTPLEYGPLDVRAAQEIAETGVCSTYEKEYIRKDGSRVPVLIGGASFEDNPDEGVRFILDLTERKKIEQQFLRAQRMESIGTLAGGIAHDLNNVLAPITMSIDLLKMKFTDKSSQELLAILGSSAQRGAEMVRQVLSFARGVEGRKMEVQVKHLLKDIEKIAYDTFPKNIQVRSIIPNELWTILGDPTQLHQVLLNLCVNARDAMPNGGILTISAENIHLDEHYAGLNPDAHPGAHVFLQITDTGTGIPPGVIEKIFDPFFTTKEIGRGTGLGLSTSLAIVKSHGGFFRVYSEPGKGTTFKAYFPAQTEASAQTAREIAAELPRGNGELILIVDDEANVRHITRQTLEAFGYRVVVASDGAEAVALVARPESEIAVVLTDMMMPVMDGPATIQVLLRLKPKLPIIAASGLSADGRVTEATSLGVKHFLSKPYSADALLKVLREILSAK